MDQALEPESPQIVGHLGAGVGMTEERFDRGSQVVVAKAVRQMGEGAERLEEAMTRGSPKRRAETRWPFSMVGHLAQAIGRAAIQQGYRVAYREAHTLLEELADAALDGTRKAVLADLATVPLLIID